MITNWGPYHYEWVEIPIYKSYKEVNHRKPVYCEECGHFEQWDTWQETVGVGRRIGVKRVKQRVYEAETLTQQYLMPKIVDSVLSESTLYARLLKK